MCSMSSGMWKRAWLADGLLEETGERPDFGRREDARCTLCDVESMMRGILRKGCVEWQLVKRRVFFCAKACFSSKASFLNVSVAGTMVYIGYSTRFFVTLLI
jgi:hypothetical protein